MPLTAGTAGRRSERPCGPAGMPASQGLHFLDFRIGIRLDGRASEGVVWEETEGMTFGIKNDPHALLRLPLGQCGALCQRPGHTGGR